MLKKGVAVFIAPNKLADGSLGANRVLIGENGFASPPNVGPTCWGGMESTGPALTLPKCGRSVANRIAGLIPPRLNPPSAVAQSVPRPGLEKRR